MYIGEGMDELEFTEAESNVNDLVSEYQQYQGNNTFCLNNHSKIKISISAFITTNHKCKEERGVD